MVGAPANGGERAVGDAQDVADADLLRRPGQAVAAPAMTSMARTA
jgi:hypothetical protein